MAVATHGLTATEVAYQILDRRLVLDEDAWYETGDDAGARPERP